MEKLKVLRVKQAAEMLSVSKAILYDWVRAGKFPKPIKLGQRAAGWTLEQIEQWLKERQSGKGQA